jgi:hypothetical protein
VPAGLGLGDDGDAVERAERVSAPGEEERRDVSVQWPASLDMSVVFD